MLVEIVDEIKCGHLACYVTPELNPIERLWEHLKTDLKWASFKTLEQLQTKVDQLLAELTPEVIASLTGYAFILDALSALNTI
jgi:putative transposase